jgi:hypothetical protein
MPSSPKLLEKSQPAYADLFCDFLPVLVGRWPCCLAVPLSARYQADFWAGFAPGRFTLGFLDLGTGYPFRISGRHRWFVAGLTPPNLNLDLVFDRSESTKTRTAVHIVPKFLRYAQVVLW